MTEFLDLLASVCGACSQVIFLLELLTTLPSLGPSTSGPPVR